MLHVHIGNLFFFGGGKENNQVARSQDFETEIRQKKNKKKAHKQLLLF